MDAPTVASWRELCMWADDRDKWRTRVRALRAPKIGVTTSIGHHVVLTSDFTFIVDLVTFLRNKYVTVEDFKIGSRI